MSLDRIGETSSQFIKGLFNSSDSSAPQPFKTDSSIASMDEVKAANDGFATLSRPILVPGQEPIPAEASPSKKVAVTAGILLLSAVITPIFTPIIFIIAISATIQWVIHKIEEPAALKLTREGAFSSSQFVWSRFNAAKKEGGTPLSQKEERKLLVHAARCMVRHACATINSENERISGLVTIISNTHLPEILDGTFQLEDADYEALAAGSTKKPSKDAFHEALKKLSSELAPRLQQIRLLSGQPKDPMWGKLAEEELPSPVQDMPTLVYEANQGFFEIVREGSIRLAVGSGIVAAALILSPILLLLSLLPTFILCTLAFKENFLGKEREPKMETLRLPGLLTDIGAILEGRKKNGQDWNSPERKALREKKERFMLRRTIENCLDDLFTAVPLPKEITNSPGRVDFSPMLDDKKLFNSATRDRVKQMQQLHCNLGATLCKPYVARRLRKEPIKNLLDGSILDQITEREWRWLARDKEQLKKELLARAEALRPILSLLKKESQDPQNKLWEGI